MINVVVEKKLLYIKKKTKRTKHQTNKRFSKDHKTSICLPCF